MIKIGLIGSGFLTQKHIEIIQNELSSIYVITGIFDTNENRLAKVAKQYNIGVYNSAEELIEDSEVIDLLSVDVDIFEIAKLSIRRQKNVLIDRIDKIEPDQAKYLYMLSKEANSIVQYSHLERFNPAFIEAKKFIQNPTFIEINRSLKFDKETTEIDVVNDLMIHDVDLVLSLMNAQLKKIQVSGSSLIGKSADVCHSRLEFNNGCVAVLDSNRMGLKSESEIKIFQPNAIIAINLLENEADIIQLEQKQTSPTVFESDWTSEGNTAEINIQKLNIPEINVIQNELSTFAANILGTKEQVVTLLDGYETLETTKQVLNKLKLTPTLM